MYHLDVEFYNDNKGNDHKLLFEKQLKDKGISIPIVLNDLISNGFKFDFPDYLIYSMFSKKDPNLEEYKDIQAISNTAYKAYDYIATKLNFDDEYIFQKKSISKGSIDNDFIEMYGVGCSLLLTNKLFNLTNADYERIPATNKIKTLDFKYLLASLGKKFVFIESKGVSEGSSQSDAIKSILDKKAAAKYETKRDLYLGIITTLPFSDGIDYGCCKIVDPDIPDFIIDPEKHNLISRLKYYKQRIELIGNPRIIDSFKILIKYLSQTTDNDWKGMYSEMAEEVNFLDNWLFRRTGRSRLYYQTENNKSYFGDGDIITLKNSNYDLFYGFSHELISAISLPTFDNIIKAKYKNEIISEVVIKGTQRKGDKNLTFSTKGEKFKIYETGEIVGFLPKTNF